MLGAGQRMAGNEMHAFRQMRRYRLHHGRLDRADIGDRRAGLQMRRDLRRDIGHGTHRHRQNHQICAFDRLGRRLADPIHKPDLQSHRPRLGRAGMADDLSRQTLFAHRQRHRAGDQPQPDQRDTLIDHAHAGAPAHVAMNWPMTCATRRHEASSPTVMRRQCGRP